METWKLIEIKFHGPYNISRQKNEELDDETGEFILITIFDTISRWIMVEPIYLDASHTNDSCSYDINLAAQTASHYIFSTLCHFGLTQFCFNYRTLKGDHWSCFPNAVEKLLMDQFEILADIMPQIVAQTRHCDKNQSNATNIKSTAGEKECLYNMLHLASDANSFDGIDEHFMENLMAQITLKYQYLLGTNSNKDKELRAVLEVLLFKSRIDSSNSDIETGAYGLSENSSFSSMFGLRSPFLTEINGEDNLINSKTEKQSTSDLSSSLPISSRRKLQSSILECRHCGDTFTSRISFKVHQKYHLSKAKEKGRLEGQKLHNQSPINETMNLDEIQEEEDQIESDMFEDNSIQDDPDYLIGKRSVSTKQIRQSTNPSHAKSNFPSNCSLIEEKPLIQDTGDNLLRKDVEDLGQAIISDVRADNIVRTGENSEQRIFAKKHHNPKMSSQTINGPLHIEKLVKENAIQNVKALLVATKCDRRKRGKYIKYDQSLRNEIAQHAEQHGASKTAKMYSEKLDCEVSESSVRNFMKSFSKLYKQSNQLKLELGGGFNESGGEEYLVKHKKLSDSDCDIPTQSKRNHNQANKNKSPIGNHKNLTYIHSTSAVEEKPKASEKELNSSQRFTCDYYLKLEIGKFAFYHGNTSAIDHFSSKLQFQMKESTVRKFKRLWMKKKRLLFQQSESTGDLFNRRNEMPLVFDSKSNPKLLTRNAFSIRLDSYCTNSKTLSKDHVDLPNPNIGTIEPRNLVLSSHSRSLFPTGYEGASTTISDVTTTQGSSTSVEEKPRLSNCSDSNEDIDNNPVSLIINNRKDQSSDVIQREDDNKHSDKNETTSTSNDFSQGKDIHNVSSLESTKKRRGKYAPYAPKLRAEIAMYSASHTNLETIKHFEAKHNIHIPESTIRGLRKTYLKTLSSSKELLCVSSEIGDIHENNGSFSNDDTEKQKSLSTHELTELHCGKRGRPMRLGKYDPLVKQCLQDLINSGDVGNKVTTFMAIATAKQVIVQNEPGLLEEYGGHIKLNVSWAKSFLKRIDAKKMIPVSINTAKK